MPFFSLRFVFGVGLEVGDGASGLCLVGFGQWGLGSEKLVKRLLQLQFPLPLPEPELISTAANKRLQKGKATCQLRELFCVREEVGQREREPSGRQS